MPDTITNFGGQHLHHQGLQVNAIGIHRVENNTYFLINVGNKTIVGQRQRIKIININDVNGTQECGVQRPILTQQLPDSRLHLLIRDANVGAVVII